MKPGIPQDAIKVFEGIVFNIWQWRQKQFDGSYKIFERAERRDSATMIVIVGDKLLISYEEQPGSAPFITLPAGQLEDGEDILTAAKRELLEETGYSGGEWELWLQSGMGASVAYVNNIYIVRGAIKSSPQRLDSGGERIISKEITFEELIELKDNPIFRNKDFSYLILQRASYDKEYKEKIRKKLWGTL